MSNTFAIDGHEFDLATVPQIGLLAQRAIAHIIRNEASSKVRGELIAEARDAKRAAANDPKVDLSDVEKKAIRFDKENATHAAMYSAAQTLLATVIRDGKIGQTSGAGAPRKSFRAPRKSEFERRVEALCRKAVISSIQSKLKLWVGEKKMPKADQLFKYKVNGAPVERTFGDMVESYYKVNKATVDKAVQKAIDDENRTADRAAKSEGEGLDF